MTLLDIAIKEDQEWLDAQVSGDIYSLETEHLYMIKEMIHENDSDLMLYPMFKYSD